MSGGPFANLRNRAGERLDVAFVAPSGDAASGARPLVVLAHGVTSAHDRPYLIALGEALAARGVAVARLSFAGNGASEGRFEECCPTKEVDDLGALLDAAVAAGFGPLGYAGHSMGGAVGVLRAARDERIAALVSLAGMHHVGRFYARVAAQLRYGELLLGKPGCPWGKALDEDARALGSLDAAAAAVRCPWLLVHGTMDELVPIGDSFDARAAAQAAGHAPELLALSGVDHRFTGAIDGLVRAVVPWLAERLAFRSGSVPPP